MNAETQIREHLFASYCEMSSKESSGMDDLTEKNVSCDGLGKLLLPSICCSFMVFATHFEEFPSDFSGLDSNMNCFRRVILQRVFSSPEPTQVICKKSHTLLGANQIKTILSLLQLRKDSILSSHSPHSLNAYTATLGQPPTPPESQEGQLKRCSCCLSEYPQAQHWAPCFWATCVLLAQELVNKITLPAPKCTCMSGFSQEGSSTQLGRCQLHFPIKK